MEILELRSPSLSSPPELIEFFTEHIHDDQLAERGIVLRTFTKDWTDSDARDSGSFERSTGEYVWTYTFADTQARDNFIANDSLSTLIKSAIAEGKVKQFHIDDSRIKAPIILLSAPRSGSTLLYEMLTHSPSLWSIRDESHHVIEGKPSLRPESRGYGSHTLTAGDADPMTAAAVRTAFLTYTRDHTGNRYVENPPSGPIRFLEKTPRNAFRIPFLNALFPDAFFVFLHRDPLGCMSSMIDLWENKDFHRSINLPGWEGPKSFRWCMALPPGWRKLSSRPTAEIAAFQWQVTNEVIMDNLSRLPKQRWCSISYRDLLADPRTQTQKICQAADIPFDQALDELTSAKLAHSSRVISAPSKNKAERNRPLIEPLLPELNQTYERLVKFSG